MFRMTLSQGELCNVLFLYSVKRMAPVTHITRFSNRDLDSLKHATNPSLSHLCRQQPPVNNRTFQDDKSEIPRLLQRGPVS